MVWTAVEMRHAKPGRAPCQVWFRPGAQIRSRIDQKSLEIGNFPDSSSCVGTYAFT
jgi:hypothetical protein